MMMALDPSLTNSEMTRRPQRCATREFEYLHALLAIGARWLPPDVFAQARTFSGVLGAQPHVLQVLPLERQLLSSFMPEAHSIHSTRSVERCLRAVGDLRERCDEAVPERCLHVRIGNFISEAVGCAAQLDRSVVMLPPAIERLGATATALARATLRPVLVVRPLSQWGGVLVGTDLEEDDAVLEQALDFGVRLGSPIMALHNASRISTGLCVPEAGLATLARGARVALAGRLERVSERLASATAILTNEGSAAAAITEQARQLHARTIVVGTRSRSWFERPIEPSVAAAVVERAECSVLVIPCSKPQRK
jgi:nucleotide-binding universal stress UspA family protein